MAKHCPLCNRSSDDIEFVGEFCKACISKRFAKKIPEKIDVQLCKSCKRIRVKGRFVSPDGEKLEELVNSKLRPSVAHLLSRTDDSVSVEVYDSETGVAVEKMLALEYKKMLCERCFKKAGGYYEAVFQLRGNETREESVLKRLTKHMTRKGEYIARVEKVRNGMDVYVSSKALASAFVAEKKLDATVTYTLSGVRRGRKVYRNTYAIHL